MAELVEQEGIEDGHELRMGFFDHLDELRQRLTKAVFALVVGTVIGVFFADRALMLLQEPFCRIPSVNNCELVILDPTGNILIYFKVALMVGGILSIPMVTYQLLMFILPGLTRKESRYVLLSIPATTVLFVVGVFFAWRILLPPALGFLNEFQAQIFEPEWTADGYISFVTSLLFWMGVAFQTPLIFFLISLLGLVSAEHLDPAMAGRDRRRIHRRRPNHPYNRPGQYGSCDGALADALLLEHRPRFLRSENVRRRSRRLSFR